MGTIAVVIGGGPLPPGAPPRFDAVIAVDSGLDVALAAGLEPTVLVGDLDSISPSGLSWARERGVQVEQHPRDKDATDTALALRLAARCGRGDLRLLGALPTDRLDHVLAVVSALGAPELACFDTVRADLGATTVHVLHPGRTVLLHAGTAPTFSLLALHGPCTGVDVDGARWPLTDATLPPSSTWGISNEQCDADVRVRVDEGVLTVIVPEATR